MVRRPAHVARTEAVQHPGIHHIACHTVVELQKVVNADRRSVRRIGPGIGSREHPPGAPQLAQRLRAGLGIQVAAEEDRLHAPPVAFAHHPVDLAHLLDLRLGRDMVQVGSGDHETRKLDDRQHARLGSAGLRQRHEEFADRRLARNDPFAVGAALERHGGTVAEVPAAHQPGDPFELENAPRPDGTAVQFVETDGIGADLAHHVGNKPIVVPDVFVEDPDIVGHQPRHTRRLGRSLRPFGCGTGRPGHRTRNPSRRQKQRQEKFQSSFHRFRTFPAGRPVKDQGTVPPISPRRYAK